MQRLLYSTVWDIDGVRDSLRACAFKQDPGPLRKSAFPSGAGSQTVVSRLQRIVDTTVARIVSGRLLAISAVAATSAILKCRRA